MSKYTMELRKVINMYGEENVKSWFKNYELSDYLTEEEIEVINNRGVWSGDKLASQILDKYYMREIGLETPALFKHYAKVRMKEIMEEKAPLIYSASIKYDPLINVDYTEQLTRSIDNNGNTSSTSTSNKTTNATNNSNSNNSTSNTNTSNSSGLTVNSDTPQGQISKETILNGDYASSTNAGESTNTTTDNGTNNTISSDTLNSTDNISSNVNNINTNQTLEGSTKTIRGNSGVSATAQKMIQMYRDNIRAINKEIIDELNDLFMGLW